MNILALCTTSSSGSIAICRNNTISYLSYLDIRITHSERLMPQIDMALQRCNLKLDDIDLICVANGPGSFTGIRIGLATAKGLCMGKQIPLLAENTLKILAYNFKGHHLPILPFIDAKMQEVYVALYNGNMQEIIAPQNARPAEFLNRIEQKVLIVGDATEVYKTEISNSEIKYQLALPHQHIPLASTLISIALELPEIPAYDFEAISALHPNYLRKSQAELVKEENEKK